MEKRRRRRRPQPIVGIADVWLQLRITNRLLALQMLESVPQNRIIEALDSLDLTAVELGDILNTSAATVAVTRSRLRKASTKDQAHGEENILSEADRGEAGTPGE